MSEPKIIDLEKHVSIYSAKQVEKICRPLCDLFGIHFFRYLKLYKNGKRVVLSTNPDAIRYMYEQGAWVDLWYDGNFPEFLKPGWYNWQINRMLDSREVEEKIENDLMSILNVKHGTTLVQENKQGFEIFSFDSNLNAIYQTDRNLFLRFTYYFKEQARQLIHAAETDGLWFDAPLNPCKNEYPDPIAKYLNETKTTRYYLAGNYGDTYLTDKEMACVKWMIAGKTAEEIAMIENNSIKTIQRHIENIKAKLNCQKQTQIIKLVLDSGF